MKKRKRLIPYFIKMLLLGVLVLLMSQIIPSLMASSLANNKYGIDAIAEIFMALMVLVVVLRYGNSYIFTEKGDKLRNTLFIGGPLLIVAIISFVANIGNVFNAPIGNVINVIILSFAIGIAEEFLCRGWIQNEFIERYGDNRKGVVLSILCASLIFGIMHYINLLSGQGLFETTLQVLQAVSSGLLFGAIYFRTKNIWNTALLHGFYDLSLFLGEVALYKDCTTVTSPDFAVRVYGYFTSLLIVIVYTLTAIYVLRKEKTDHLIEKEYKEVSYEEKRRYNILKVVIALLFLVIFLPIGVDEEDNYRICYSYDEMSSKGLKYEISYPYYDSYNINGTYDGEEYNLVFTTDHDDNLYLTNNSINKKVKIVDNINSYKVIENQNKFVLIVDTKDDVYYLEENYDSLANTEEYLNNFKKKLTVIYVPTVEEIGYMTTDSNDEKIPIIRTDLKDIFVIKDSKKIEVLK